MSRQTSWRPTHPRYQAAAEHRKVVRQVLEQQAATHAVPVHRLLGPERTLRIVQVRRAVVLSCAARGLSICAISHVLKLDPSTVRNHMRKAAVYAPS